MGISNLLRKMKSLKKLKLEGRNFNSNSDIEIKFLRKAVKI